MKITIEKVWNGYIVCTGYRQQIEVYKTLYEVIERLKEQLA